MTDNRRGISWTWPAFLSYTLLFIWVAHAFVFFAHEYAHTFTAWLLGWKDNPLALNYAHPTALVFLMQLGIDQDVDEARIFASGHGVAAAVIAVAGSLFGNAFFTLPLSRWVYAKAIRAGSRGWAMLAYWVSVASIGNFLDYVPIRTFTPDGDMGSITRGLGCSPWAIIIILGIPTLLALYYFFARIQPATLAALFPEARGQRWVVAGVTAWFLFSFYGAAGLLEGGPISYKLSMISVCVFFPLMTIVGGRLVQRKVAVSGPRLLSQ
jgi:hypothetical protein